jgi:hypothetical protein
MPNRFQVDPRAFLREYLGEPYREANAVRNEPERPQADPIRADLTTAEEVARIAEEIARQQNPAETYAVRQPGRIFHGVVNAEAHDVVAQAYIAEQIQRRAEQRIQAAAAPTAPNADPGPIRRNNEAFVDELIADMERHRATTTTGTLGQILENNGAQVPLAPMAPVQVQGTDWAREARAVQEHHEVVARLQQEAQQTAIPDVTVLPDVVPRTPTTGTWITTAGTGTTFGAAMLYHDVTGNMTWANTAAFDQVRVGLGVDEDPAEAAAAEMLRQIQLREERETKQRAAAMKAYNERPAYDQNPMFRDNLGFIRTKEDIILAHTREVFGAQNLVLARERVNEFTKAWKSANVPEPIRKLLVHITDAYIKAISDPYLFHPKMWPMRIQMSSRISDILKRYYRNANNPHPLFYEADPGQKEVLFGTDKSVRVDIDIIDVNGAEWLAVKQGKAVTKTKRIHVDPSALKIVRVNTYLPKIRGWVQATKSGDIQGLEKLRESLEPNKWRYLRRYLFAPEHSRTALPQIWDEMNKLRIAEIEIPNTDLLVGFQFTTWSNGNEFGAVISVETKGGRSVGDSHRVARDLIRQVRTAGSAGSDEAVVEVLVELILKPGFAKILHGIGRIDVMDRLIPRLDEVVAGLLVARG